MGFKMPHIVVIVGLVAAGIALLFQIIAVAAAGWTKSGSYEYGLWKVCLSGQCVEYGSDVTDSLKATRAFGLLGLFFIAGALVVGILIMFIDNKFFPLIAGGVAGIAALCVLISFAIYADKTQSIGLSYCFALSVVAFLLCIASAVCFIVSKFLGSSNS